MRLKVVATESPTRTTIAQFDRSRWSAAWPFAVVGLAAVIAGGFVAAATAPSPSENGSWATAYLVLVVGVAQLALGAGQAMFASRVPSKRQVGYQALGWNVANAAVMCGTLADVHALVYAGSALLVVTLIAFLYALRAAQTGGVQRTWPILSYRALVVVLLVSVPVGCIISAVHAHS
ncbi:MAG: hypothetical protein ACRDV3_15470 [Acidothermaceae bacterium]